MCEICSEINRFIEIKQDTEEELVEKLKHEKRMQKDLATLFTAMGDFFRIEIERNGISPRFDNFEDDVRALLKKNYRLTSNKFKFNIREAENLGDLESVNIDTAINQFIDNQSRLSSRNIIDTTNKVGQQAVDGTLEESDEPVATEALAVTATRSFNKRNKKRNETIALTETQKASENAKEQEALSLTLAGVVITTKTWSSILDDRTRMDHVIADGQTVNITEPFIVGGERLNYPGDRSLGASPGNIINCRCSSTINILRVNRSN